MPRGHKGKTYEEIYGKEKAEELKKRISKTVSKKQTGKRNSFYGKHHSEKTKDIFRKNKLGKTYEELYGEKKALEIKKKIGNNNKKWYSDYFNEYESRFFDPLLRKNILMDQSFICPMCGDKLGIRFKKNLHHINYIKKDNRRRNLIYLCVGCHSTTNGNRGFWKGYLRGINREIIRNKEILKDVIYTEEKKLQKYLNSRRN